MAARRITIRTLKIVAAILFGAYLWSTIPGRYQVEQLGPTPLFVVLDTATGRHWVYKGDVKDGKAHYSLEDQDTGVVWHWRLWP